MIRETDILTEGCKCKQGSRDFGPYNCVTLFTIHTYFERCITCIFHNMPNKGRDRGGAAQAGAAGPVVVRRSWTQGHKQRYRGL